MIPCKECISFAICIGKSIIKCSEFNKWLVGFDYISKLDKHKISEIKRTFKCYDICARCAGYRLRGMGFCIVRQDGKNILGPCGKVKFRDLQKFKSGSDKHISLNKKRL